MKGALLGALALGLTLGVAACDTTGPRNGTRVSVFLTDAPGDVEAVWLQVDGITLTGDAAGDLDLGGDFAQLIRVTDFVDQLKQLVADAPVQPDTYRQLRLRLGAAVLQTKQGRVYATPGATLPAGLPAGEVGVLQCPSCSQTGIKLVLRGSDAQVREGEHVQLVLDFDVAQSFGKQAGNSGRWVMRPVVHATRVPSLTNAPMGNAITGTVRLQTDAQGNPTVQVPQCPAGTNRSLADFVPTAVATTLRDADDNPVVRSGTVTSSGTFSIDLLNPDSYTLGFHNVEVGDAQSGNFRLTWTASAAPAQVVVANGQATPAVVYTVTGASCAAM